MQAPEPSYVKPVSSPFWDFVFARVHLPGIPAPYTGIYRCNSCGHEVVATKGNNLPTAATHAHPITCGGMQWQLLVATDNQP